MHFYLMRYVKVYFKLCGVLKVAIANRDLGAALYVYLDSNYCFIESLDFKHEVSDFKSFESIFRMCRPSTLMLLSQRLQYYEHEL